VWELLKVAERGVTLSRVFNMREGFTRSDDVLPERMTTPVRKYPGIAPEVFEESLSTFYGMMGWNPETGLPTLDKLRELDVEWAAQHLS
jgi:aldehyde:ferredoxin oxidoreductase